MKQKLTFSSKRLGGDSQGDPDEDVEGMKSKIKKSARGLRLLLT